MARSLPDPRSVCPPHPHLSLASSRARAAPASRRAQLSRHEIEARYDVVDAFARGFETRSLLRDEVLPKMGGDLDRLGRAFQARKAGLKEVVALYAFVLSLPKLIETLEAHKELATDDDEAALIARRFTRPIQTAHANFANLVRLVQTAVDLAAAQRHEYVLQSHFSAALHELSEARAEVLGRVRAHYDALCSKCDMDSDRMHLELDARLGHCLRVTRAIEKDLRACAAVKSGRVKLTQLQTKKDGVLYQDTMLASLA
jgi:DNA mismatch repair ATPase MutS